MYDIEFIDAATGATIGEVPRARGIPAKGSEVLLEHAVYGPVPYRVVKVPQHWYPARRGNLAKPDQYEEGPVKVAITPTEDGR